MQSSVGALIAAVIASVAVLISTAAQSQILKGEPAEGSLAFGKRVLVDDGTCPAGQIKEVTGGSNVHHNARPSRCIPHRGGRK